MSYPADETDLTGDQMDEIMIDAEQVEIVSLPMQFPVASFVAESQNASGNSQFAVQSIVLGGQLISLSQNTTAN